MNVNVVTAERCPRCVDGYISVRYEESSCLQCGWNGATRRPTAIDRRYGAWWKGWGANG